MQNEFKLAVYAGSVEKFKAMSEIGYKYVHLSGFPGLIPEGKEEAIRQVKEALRDYNLEVCGLVAPWDSIGLSGTIPSFTGASGPWFLRITEREKGIQIMKRIIRTCRAIGCDLITAELGGHPVYRIDHQEAWKISIEELCPILEEEGVRLSMEPHPGNFLEENNPAVDLIKEVKCRNVGYTYCAPHTFILAGRYDADVGSMIEYAKDVLMDVHVADALRPEMVWCFQHSELFKYHSHLTPGRGVVDIKGIFRALKRINYCGYVTSKVYTLGLYPMTELEVEIEAKKAIEKTISEL